jgi:hypothetical protein
MGVLGPLFVGLTVLKLVEYVKDYVQLSWNGDIRGGGKSLAKGLAAGAIELISWLTFKAAGAAMKGAKALAKGVVRLAQKAASALAKGFKFVIEKAKVLFSGLLRTAGKGLGKAAKKLADLGEKLLEKLRFRKFRIIVKGRWFAIEGWINPWIVILEGEIKQVTKGTKDAQFYTEEELKRARQGLEPPHGKAKVADVDTYRELQKDTTTGLHRDHIPAKSTLKEAYKESLRTQGTKIPPKGAAARKQFNETLKQIDKEGFTIRTEPDIHRAGFTYGQSLEQAALDAKDLQKAMMRDIREELAVIEKAGKLTPDRVTAYMQLWNKWVARGKWMGLKAFKHTPEADKMFMEFLKKARL